MMAYLTDVEKLPVLIAPLAASACIIFVMPDAILAQPKNVILGHVISALVGSAFYEICGAGWLISALSTAVAVLLMDVSGTMHPPAAATCVIAVTTGQNHIFAIMPVGLGAIILVISGISLHKIFKDGEYPHRTKAFDRNKQAGTAV